MKYRILILLLVIIVQFSCKNDDTLSSFTENNKKIEDSNENINIKNEAYIETMYIQAEKDDALIDRRDRAKRVHAIGANFYAYIDDLKKTMKKKNSMEFVNELFFNNGEITNEGEEFLMYIKNYKESMNSVIGQSNPRILGMVNNNFDTSVIEDRRGQKTNWLTLNFNDFSPIVSITKLSDMQSDIRRIEMQYFAELLGVKLHTRTKTTVSNINDATKKQLGENIQPALKDEKDISEEIKKEVIKPIVKEKIVEEVKKPKVEVAKKTIKKYHTVESGETLYRIALKNKISVEKLKKLNGMKNNSISVGEKLKVK